MLEFSIVWIRCLQVLVVLIFLLLCAKFAIAVWLEVLKQRATKPCDLCGEKMGDESGAVHLRCAHGEQALSD